MLPGSVPVVADMLGRARATFPLTVQGRAAMQPPVASIPLEQEAGTADGI
jgi:hypothetical protein